MCVQLPQALLEPSKLRLGGRSFEQVRHDDLCESRDGRHGRFSGRSLPWRNPGCRSRPGRTKRRRWSAPPTMPRGLRDVNGFRLRSGWYAIALGPFSEDEARPRLSQLRADTRRPVRQFRLRRLATSAGRFFGSENAAARRTCRSPNRFRLWNRAKKRLAEARAGERDLTRDDRELIQIALAVGRLLQLRHRRLVRPRHPPRHGRLAAGPAAMNRPAF